MKRLWTLGLLMSVSCSPDPMPAPPPPAAPEPDFEAGFEKLDPPKPGEWLAHFKEDGQTFEEYVSECANRKSPERPVFYIQPLGEAGTRYAKTLALMRDYAEAFFNVKATVCDPIPMFENGYVPQRRQYNSTMIIGQLTGRAPKDALVYIGITDHDLFSRGLNFVFGEGNLRDRTGVYSLRRYAAPDPVHFNRRALKLMAHEVGHILSIHHCIYFKCVMQGANSLDEDDRHPMHLCPVDLRKLEWNTGFDRAERYRRLQEFYAAAGMSAEAEWVAGRLPAR